MSTSSSGRLRGSWLSGINPGAAEWVDRFGGEPRKGADILVQALEREGCGRVFAYPGGASMEIHQALTRSASIRNILCRHEQARPAHAVPPTPFIYTLSSYLPYAC
jgi:hypothetical protein